MTQDFKAPHHRLVARRLSALTLTLMLACAFLLLLQPLTSSAQDTSDRATPDFNRASDATPTPTATPDSKQPTAARLQIDGGASRTNSLDGDPIDYTRGYSNLVAAYYAYTNFTSLVATNAYSSPIDFIQACEGEQTPYNGCKLIKELPTGADYAVRWTGKLLVPSEGTYTFTLDKIDAEARLLINGVEVVNGRWNTDCFSHDASAANTYELTAGVHDVVVEYRQCWPGFIGLQVRWAGPEFADEVIPVAMTPGCGCPLRPCNYSGSCGGPIDTFSGDYRYEQHDISVAASGEALHFKRTYDAQSTGLYTGTLGYGWTHNYNLRLITSTAQPGGEGGVVVFEGCGGERFRFLKNNHVNGTYEALPGIFATLTRTLTAPYSYTLTTANQLRYIFDANGLPVEIRDPQGNATHLIYSGTRLLKLADATGQRYLNFSYDGQGRLAQISDPLSRTVGYGYDVTGNLTVVTDTRGFTWTYTYTGTHLLNEIRDPLGALVERTEFDAQNRAIRQWTSASSQPLQIQYSPSTDALGFKELTTVITDALGHVRVDEYNARGTLMVQTQAGNPSSRAYDAHFNWTASTDPNGNATGYIYNSMGRPLVITDAQGQITAFQYDTQNNLTRLTDAHGASTYYTYTNGLLTAQRDAVGRTQIYTYGQYNRLIAQQDQQGRVTQYAYNDFGERTVITDAQGFATYSEYDLIGRLITTTDAFGRITINAYDHADHVIATTNAYTSTSTEQNYLHAYNLVTRYGYDAAGRQVLITDTLGRVSRSGYDAAGRLVSATVNYSPTHGPNYLNLYNLITQYGYDALGNQILVTDTLGHVTKTEYDDQLRPVTVTTNYVDGLFDPARPDEDLVRVTQYDAAGNPIAQIDPLGHINRTGYDSLNRPISVTVNYSPTRPQNAGGEYNLVTWHGYDEVGHQILVTDTVGRVTRNEYDAAGRLISTTANYAPGLAPNYLTQYNLTTVYGYDASGRQYLVTNALGLTNRTDYDSQTGRPITSTTNYADGIFDPAQPDEDVAQVTEYDAHGNAILRRDAAGRATRTWYDALNRVISVTVNYQPDLPQNDQGQFNLATTYGYDEVGNHAWVTDTAGRVAWTQYDGLNRAITVTQNYLSGYPFNYAGQYNLVTTYEYDALGRQVAAVDPLGRRTRFEFDQAGRISAQINPLEQQTAYAYDALGNRTVITDAADRVTRFDYDTLNRLITTTRYLDGDPIREVTHYDALGNRTETIDARGQATSFGYDVLGRTVAITDANLHVMTFAYDVLGRRTAQTDALQHTLVYTSDRLGRQIATSDPLGNTTQYRYDVIGNRVAMTDANHRVTHYEYDALSRLSAVVENFTGGAQTDDRDVRTAYAYDAFGNRTVITNALGYTTTSTYDALNRLATQTDPLEHITTQSYDALGNRTVLTVANGQVTLSAYDSLNRLATITYTADATAVNYAYDEVGNRTIMTDAVGVTQYTYDDLNRLTHVDDPYDQTVAYGYDAAGNRTQLVYPDGKAVTYTFDAASRLASVEDWSGGTTTYQYDAANRLVTTTLPNNVRTLYRYDEANRLIQLTHTRISDGETLADYQFQLDGVGNRLSVTEALLYPGDELAALPATTAEEVVQTVTGLRAPGLSALAVQTDTVSISPANAPVQWPSTSLNLRPLSADQPANDVRNNGLVLAAWQPGKTPFAPQIAGQPPIGPQTLLPLMAPLKTERAMPWLAPGDIFSDSFEAGNFSAWSAAVTNTGWLSVTPGAAMFGQYGLRAVITDNTAMYVRTDTPAAEPRYRARFYFNPNSIGMNSGDTHDIFVGRNITGTDVFRVQFRKSSGNYQILAQLVNDAATYSSTAWQTISNARHPIEIDWKAATAVGANNGYITLWIDGVSKATVSGIDNDTRRVDEARLGPLNGIDTNTRGTEYFDAFESRQSTYIGPVVLADFTASPVVGTAPLTVTFVNASQPITDITSYLWNFGDGYTSTITQPVHTYAGIGYYTVTLTVHAGVHSDTLTKTQFITVAEVIFKDGFESGSFAAWSAAVTNTGLLSLTAAAAQSGLYGMRAQISSVTAMYVRDDTPTAESRYRARFYFHPNSINMTSTNAHYLLAGRTGSTDVLYVEFRNYSGSYQIRAQIRNDSTTYSSTSWYTIANGWHFIEIDWKADTAVDPGTPNGYITLWIDGAQQGSVTGIDNDTRRVDEARLGPLSGIDSGTSGTEYFDAFESRRTTYLGPAGVMADFTAGPTQGQAPLTVTFTNTSQPTATITAYMWNFGDGYTSTITNPVHNYALPGVFTVTLTAWAGADANTVTRTNFITATVKADFASNPTQGLAPLTVTFTSTSQPTSGITSYLWTFGDGYTSTITNPVHLYASPGYFTVTLTARSGSLQDTLTKTQCVTATLLAGFTASPVEGNLPLTVTFANTSQPPAGLTAYQWNFGDGYTSPITNPVHAYSTAGFFTVTLTAWAGVMQDTVTKTQFITTTDNTPVSGDFVIGQPLGSGPDNPQPAYNSVQDEYLVVWHEYNGISGDYILGQRLTGNGHLLGSRLTISNGLGLVAPDVAYDPVRNQYLVMWSTNLAANNVVQGRFIAATGTLGALITVSDAPSDETSAASLAYNSAADAYLVAWYGYVNEAGGLWQQRIAGAGTLSGSNAAILETDYLQAIEVIANPVNAEWLIAWDDGFTIAAQRVASNGTPAGSAVTVAGWPDDKSGVAVDVTAAGDYLVVWQDGQDIRGQRVTANGSLSGSVILIGVVADTAQESPTIAYRPEADDFLVVWQDDRNGLDYDLYGAYVPSTGGTLNGGFALVEAENDQLSPAIVYAQATQTFLLAWQDQRDGFQIYGRRWLPPVAGFDITPPAGLAPLAVTFANQTTPTVGIDYHWDFGDGEVSTEVNPTHTYALPGLMDVALTATRADGLHIRSQVVQVNPSVGQAVVVAADPAANEDAPAVAYDALDQEYLTVWAAWDGQYDIYARRALSTGLPIGSVLPIVADTGDQRTPVVAYGQGVYLVVWSDNSEIWGQRVLPSGVLTGTGFVIGTGGTGNTAPAVNYNPLTAEFLVAWVNSGNGNRIQVRRVSTAGGLLGTPIEIPATYNDLKPSIAHDAWGNYLMVFLCDEFPDAFAVCGQRLSGGGALLGSAFQIYSAPSNSTSTQLAYDPHTAEYLVVWREADGGASDEVYARRVSSAGTVMGNAIALGAQSGEPSEPKVAYHPSARTYVVVWSDQRNGDWDAYVRPVQADGALWDEALPLEDTADNQTGVTVSSQGANDDLLIAYIDDRSGSPDLYVERYIPPMAIFTAAPASGLAPLTVNFADQSTAVDPDTWAWDFGDGATSSAQNPSHTYTALGQFTAVFTVTSGAKVYTNTGVITVHNPVTAQFVGTPLTGVRPLTVTFTDQSTTTYGTLNAWQWDFGDGATSTQQNPTHVYSIAGSFTVKLVASTGTYSDTEEKSGYVTIPVPNRVVITYTYDGLNRLTQATSTGAVSNTFEYGYDAVGNRTTQTATITSTQVTNYVYDAANRLSSVNGQAFTWDDNGNLVNDGDKTYTYDQANRLTDLTQGATTFQFNYNGDGARLKQIIAGVPTTYTQDLAAPLPVVLQSKTGTNATRYVYAFGTRPLAQRGTAWEYLLADALGSVRQIVDADGSVTLAESYEPYGSVLNSNGTASSIFGYSGEEVDTSGLVYLRARYMQPMLGMFLSRDPWNGDVMQPGSMNGFGYVEGDPVGRVDPTGRFSAVALARSFGYGEGIEGVTRMLAAVSWDHPWGWLKLLLDAEDGDTVHTKGVGPLIDAGQATFRGSLYCKKNIVYRYQPPPCEARACLSSPRPGPDRPFSLLTWWRRQGNYILSSRTGLHTYRDGGDSGGQTDLPDIAILGAGGSVGVVGGQVSLIIDKFGRKYESGAVGWSPGFPVSVSYGEGYIGRGSIFTGFNRELWTADQLREAIGGRFISLGLQLGAGGEFDVSSSGYTAHVFSSGYGAGAHVMYGDTRDGAIDPQLAWDDLFFWPAPSRTEVYDQAMQSVFADPCGECDAP